MNFNECELIPVKDRHTFLCNLFQTNDGPSIPYTVDRYEVPIRGGGGTASIRVGI